MSLCERLERVAAENALEVLEAARAEWEGLPEPSDDVADRQLHERFLEASRAAVECHANYQDRVQINERLEALSMDAERLAGEEPLADEAWAAVRNEWASLQLRTGALDPAVSERFAAADARVRLRAEEQRAVAERTMRQQVQRIEQLIERANARALADDLTLREADRIARGDVARPPDPGARAAVVAATDRLYKETVRTKIAVDKRRPDGRSETEIRPIACSVSVMPRTHGSALFTRGQTQALTLCTLGTAKEEQRIDDLSLDETKRYIHHYNFPPYSVGETGFMRGPKRRDIGHGALAERALVPVIPSAADFPYTLRLVSEILESNGSSSMASVCGSTLSLMDAGVPITAPVAGIAMGLIKEGDSYVILTDIQGAEDHLGDMDFKVAGTEQGVTALQMDIKITGVTTEILRSALAQARDARLHILAKMREAISEPRTELAAHAPRITSTKIAPDFIGMVIGKGGETIRSLEADYEVQIDIEEDGTIRIYGTNGELAEQARLTIEAMTKEVEVGDEYTGKIVKITDFGAFVELRKGVDGLLHVSRILPQGNRLQSAAQVLDRGDVVRVVVVEVDKDRGRIGLTLVAKIDGENEVLPQELVEVAENTPAPPREERPPRGGDRGGRDRGRRR